MTRGGLEAPWPVAQARKSAATGGPSRAAQAPLTLVEPPRLPFDFLECKTQVPAQRPGSVSRTALVNQLRSATAFRVVTVTAPAGYGKTTLLTQLATRDSRPFAWVSIDERDHNPLVLLRSVAAALARIGPLDAKVLASLHSPGDSIWTALVPRLAAAMSSREPFVLVLDDFHLLRSRKSLQAISVLGSHIPEGSMLVLAGRTTPRLGIAALRASGRLLEIGVDQLAMSRREAHLLLRAAGVDSALDGMTELVARCEGWPAALYLAALSLCGDKDVEARRDRVTTFRGDDRYLADYFRSEYLSSLAPSALRFLRRTSVLDELCGPLCDAVLQTEGSAQELEKIEHSNLFLVPLDRRRDWYRYHGLFRDILRRELAESEPRLVGVLHSRAADWYEAHGDPQSALDHASAASDGPRVAELLTALALPTYHSGNIETIEGWLARIDRSHLERYPGVALQGAWIHALRGRRVEAECWLETAEQGTFEGALPDGCVSLDPWIAVLRAAMCQEGVYQMLADAETGLAELPPHSLIHPYALLVSGAAYLFLGQQERSDAIFARVAAEAESLGAMDTCVVAISERSVIAEARGEVEAADALALQALGLVEQRHLDGFATSAIALATAVGVLVRHGRSEEAREQLARAVRLQPLLADSALPWLTVQTGLALARAHLTLRNMDEAGSTLRELNDVLLLRPHLGVLSDQVDELHNEVEAAPELADGAKRGLTGAELRLLPLLATHLSFREIGEQLYVSRHTVKTQAISIYRKLGAASRSDAINEARRLGLVQPR